jgi:hypothetical protein
MTVLLVTAEALLDKGKCSRACVSFAHTAVDVLVFIAMDH